MLTYESEALLTMTRPKGRRGSGLGTSLLRVSLSRNPKRILFTPAVAIEGKGRRDREAGNNELRMVIGRARCRDADIGDAITVYIGTASRLRSGSVHAFRAVPKKPAD